MENWKLKVNGKDQWLQFEEEGHRYLLDGKPIPSITQVIKINHPNKYSNVSEEVLKKAAEKGTAMHQALQDYEEVGIENDMQELMNYKLIKKVYGFEFVEAEKPIVIEYKGHYFAGRVDQLIKINGVYAINDFKRYASMTKDMKEDLCYQTNLYRIGYKMTYGIDCKELHGTRLRDDIKEFYDLPIDEKLAYELLDRYLEENI